MQNQYSLPTYRLFSAPFLRAYLITMRPYLLFVSGITGILGLSFVQNLDITTALLVFSVSFLAYGFGQALTDCFQIDTDSISSPYRPLTQGIVSRKHFLILSIAGLSYCVIIFSYFYPPVIIPGLLAGLGLATYTTFKRKWWAGPFYNSWIVVVLFLIAYLAGTNGVSIQFENKIYYAIFAVFFAYSNFVLVGYFKDTEADKKTGYNTMPVVFGKKWASIISDVFGILSVTFTLLTLLETYNNVIDFLFLIPAFLFFILGSFMVLSTQLLLRDVHNDSEAHIAIVPSVKSYILLLMAIILSEKPEWIPVLLLFYLTFLIVLKTRPIKNQI
jgi:4-hydroxybenzoate polyprenyltransferase